ncbi:hypothetical protein ACFQE1_03740 [Halobium palmae]|uniref:Uncharacterized protein n=1 Tax=Halobium palmae TaxID=1776492 RepID=A0ABD5RW73_9EURY
MPNLFQQVRRVIFGSGLRAVADGGPGDLDMDISVRPGSESLKFDVGIWNLSDENWESVKREDTVDIELGWAETSVERVCMGKIDKTYTETANNGADTRYVVRGVDATLPQLNERISRTFTDRNPGYIARRLAEECDVGFGLIEDADKVIEGKYPVTKDRSVRHHLRMLLNEAGKLTGDQWLWSARRGELYFHRESTTTEDNVRLWASENDGNLLSANHSTGSSTQDGAEEISFEAYCEPGIRKDGTVQLESRVASGSYKVSDFEFRSDTTTGEHEVTGTLVPEGAQYSADFLDDLSFFSPARQGTRE